MEMIATSMNVSTIRPLEVRHTAHEGVQFRLSNLFDILNWIGDDFYALTNGDPIGIEGHMISRNKSQVSGNDNPEINGMTHPTLVVSNKDTNRLLVVAEGEWLIKEPGMGYQVFTDDVVSQRYVMDKTTSEEE